MPELDASNLNNEDYREITKGLLIANARLRDEIKEATRLMMVHNNLSLKLERDLKEYKQGFDALQLAYNSVVNSRAKDLNEYTRYYEVLNEISLNPCQSCTPMVNKVLGRDQPMSRTEGLGN